jgi:hypothetical protein
MYPPEYTKGCTIIAIVVNEDQRKYRYVDYWVLVEQIVEIEVKSVEVIGVEDFQTQFLSEPCKMIKGV